MIDKIMDIQCGDSIIGIIFNHVGHGIFCAEFSIGVHIWMVVRKRLSVLVVEQRVKSESGALARSEAPLQYLRMIGSCLVSIMGQRVGVGCVGH